MQMRKSQLAQLGLIGLLGVTVGCQNSEKNSGTKSRDSQQQKAGSMSEEELLTQLDEKGKALYYSMDEEGKALALKLSSMSCAGQNECAGLNSCKSSDNPCAGQGKCQGTSGCGFADKNLAVKVAAKHMAEKMENSDY